jgi:PAS domain-containing protein
MNISSGLGHVTPRNVLILPISKEDRVFGAIELSSFKTFEPHQIEFLNKLGQSIGGTFDSIEASIRTQMLLKESQQQRELLIEHEQNLMLNLEKVEHIQRTTAKREAELKSILKALHNIAPVTEYNMDGEIIFANRVLLNLLERPEAYLLGKKQGSLRLNQTEEPYEDFWKDLKRGITKYDLQHIRVGEKDLWLSGAFTPILDENGIPYKVLNISTNITYQKQLELQIQHFEAQTSKDADAQ